MVPSINYEISTLVIFEAFREKTPVIVNNIGAPPELIEYSRGGIVYNSEAELVGAMDLLLADPSYREELGRRGYEAYLRKWNPESHLSLYLDLIERMVRGRKPGSRLYRPDQRPGHSYALYAPAFPLHAFVPPLIDSRQL
jgi:glycosyltransferase involved in cell wall biosynthesis